MTYYIFVTGSMSGLGKGLVSASIAKILQDIGYKVSIVKIDPYLNVDAGTMSPYEHGEVFVTADGYEADQDLGLYERFLNRDMTKANNITSGRVYQAILRKERQGKYLGKTVQIVPHAIDEILFEIDEVVKKEKPCFCIVEIGGTVGDIESAVFLEAARQLSLEKKVCFVHVTFVPTLTLEEQKTKLTQQSVRGLREVGIEPNFIFARSNAKLSGYARKKIALFCNVQPENIISAYDVDDIYTLPLNFAQQNFDILLLRKFGLHARKAKLRNWKVALEKKKQAKRRIKIAIIGKYSKLKDAYVSIEQALKHCEYALALNILLEWLEAEKLDIKELKKYDGILVPGGFGVRGTEEKIKAIKLAREKNIPFLGLCLGFQLAVIEFARDVIGMGDASSAEFMKTANPVINLLPGQDLDKMGGTMRLGEQTCSIKEGTLAYRIYKKNVIKERHRHRYEFNYAYSKQFEQAGMVFSGASRFVEILELPGHGFFIATQFHPEFKSRLEQPAPIFLAFSRACLNYKKKKQEQKRGKTKNVKSKTAF